MKKKVLKFILIGMIIFSFNIKVAFADDININSNIKNNMNENIGNVRKEVSYEGWHSSGGNKKWSGYWEFYRTQGDQGVGRKYQKPDGKWKYVKINDSDIKYFFKGKSKELPGGDVIEEYDLPNQVKKFVDVYGAKNIGIKFNVGNNKSVENGKFSYKIENNKIYIKFTGILNYVRYNMWQVLNPRVVNQMNRPEVCVPQVLEGCGDNRISLGKYGKEYMKLNENLVKRAYHSRGSNWLNILGYKSLWGTFSNGGNNGVKWYFPINVDFYDLGVYTNPLALDSKNIYKDNRGNWVKVGNEFTLNQSGYASNIDKVVKVNENDLNVNGNKEYINSWLWNDENSSNNVGNIGKANIGLKLNSESTNRVENGKTLNSIYNLQATKEGDYTFNGYSKLINNVKEDNSHKFYKKSNTSNSITIKADGKAPTGNCNVNYNDKNNVVNIKVINVSDNEGSGVKRLWVHYIDKNNPNITKDIELNKNYENEYIQLQNLNEIFDKKTSDIKIQIFTEDNVGNIGELADKDVSVLNLKASIYRVLKPHEPVFFTSETGVVKVNLFGGFDRLEIIFPKELTDLNNKLNLDIKLTPKLNDSYEYKFIVPQKAEDKDYRVHVIGHKGNEIKEAFPIFKVDGNIARLLKTRIRLPGDINS